MVGVIAVHCEITSAVLPVMRQPDNAWGWGLVGGPTCMYEARSGMSALSVGEISFDRSSCQHARAQSTQHPEREHDHKMRNRSWQQFSPPNTGSQRHDESEIIVS